MPEARPPDDTVRRLLIVDDEPHIRSALLRALGLMGYEVEGAASGREALQMLRQATYDLVILDMRMPDLSGLDVIEQARELDPGILIIVLTGHATLESAIAAVKAEEVVDYLLKPAPLNEVASAVARALDRHGERSERERLVGVIHSAMSELQRRQRGGDSGADPVAPFGKIIRRDPLLLDTETGLVGLVDDPSVTVELTEGETAVLKALMMQPGKVLSPAELGRALWNQVVSDQDAEGPIRSVIFRIRRKLQAMPEYPDDLINTARGRGYFVALPDADGPPGLRRA